MEITLSNAKLQTLRTTLRVATQVGVFQSVKADYAADKTLESLDSALSTFDDKRQQTFEDNVITDGENKYLMTDERTGVDLWVMRTQRGAEFTVDHGPDADDVPLDNHYVDGDATYLEEHGEPSMEDLSHVYEDGGREAQQEALNDLATEKTKVDLHLLSVANWTKEGAIDREAMEQMRVHLQQNGIAQRPHNLLRKTLVEGNQDSLLEDEEDRSEE